MSISLPLRFSAAVVSGAKRGTQLGTPTLNLALSDIPDALAYGIYACRAWGEDGKTPHAAVLHYGPRPVFRDTVSCEVHLLDTHIDHPPKHVLVEIAGFLRGPETFDLPSSDALVAQIAQDIADARAILGST